MSATSRISKRISSARVSPSGHHARSPPSTSASPNRASATTSRTRSEISSDLGSPSRPAIAVGGDGAASDEDERDRVVVVSKVGRKTLGFSITFRTMQRPPEPEPVVPVVPNELILVAPDGAEVEGVVDLHALLELDLAADDPALQPAPETVAVVTSIEPDVQINGDGELRVGDVIVAVDGVAIAGISAAQLIGMLNGDEVEVTVRAMQPAPLTHGADAADAAPDAEFTVMLERGTGRKPLGFEIAITPKDRRVEVTKVNPHGLAKLLKPGDCVRAINKIELASLPDLSMAWIRGLVDRDKVDLSITRKLSSGIDPQEGCTIC